MHGPVAFVQTTSQLSLVFSVITSVAGMTPQTLFENARSPSPGLPLALSRADPVGVDVRESVHAALVSNATAQARRLAVLHVPVCITSPCRRGATIPFPQVSVNHERLGAGWYLSGGNEQLAFAAEGAPVEPPGHAAPRTAWRASLRFSRCGA